MLSVQPTEFFPFFFDFRHPKKAVTRVTLDRRRRFRFHHLPQIERRQSKLDTSYANDLAWKEVEEAHG